MNIQPNTQQVEALLSAVFCAGQVILSIRKSGIIQSEKPDGSPVTEADQKAEIILLEALHGQFAHIPSIGEEAAEAGSLPEVGKSFFLVDALDGTKEFVRGGADFTVNIGLIDNGVPVFGIVYAPADGRLFVGSASQGAWRAEVNCQDQNPSIKAKRPLMVRSQPKHNPIAVASRSHRDPQTNDWLAERGITNIVSAGSSIKFCLLAAGEADLYPRFGPTMEWDTAAAHAILNAAGGRVTGISGEPFIYGKQDQARPFLNPGFIAYGRSTKFK